MVEEISAHTLTIWVLPILCMHLVHMYAYIINISAINFIFISIMHRDHKPSMYIYIRTNASDIPLLMHLCLYIHSEVLCIRDLLERV